jgi:hypothetical protein
VRRLVRISFNASRVAAVPACERHVQVGEPGGQRRTPA